VNRVHGTLLNGARPRALLTMIIGTFGVGFAAGIHTTQLSEGRGPAESPATPRPSLAMAALVLPDGEPGADPARDVFVPGTWLGGDQESAEVPLAAQLSVT
jgi:hypothetical protein